MTEVPTTEWSRDFDDDVALDHAPLKAKWRRLPGLVTHVFTHFPLELIVYAASVPAARKHRRHALDAACRLPGRGLAECDAQGDRPRARGRHYAAATQFFENAACARALTCYPPLRRGLEAAAQNGGDVNMESTRRGMMTAAGAAAALAAIAPQAFAQWQPSERYPDPDVQMLDPAFNALRLGLASVEQLCGRLPLERRPGLDGRLALPAVERHPEQPHHALGRRNRPRQRLPQALQQRERQHARPPGPPHHLRARHAPRHAHRISTAASRC